MGHDVPVETKRLHTGVLVATLIGKRLRITGAAASIRGSSLELYLDGRPVVREEFGDAVDWMGADA
jgi:hypothetical protein